MKAYIIGRPYHLLNAINYAHSFHEDGDAYILNEYPNAEIDYKKVVASGIFREVFLVNETKTRPKGFLKELCYVIQRGFFPIAFIERVVVDTVIDRKRIDEYNEVFSASPGSFVIALLNISKAKYSVLEDGAATYSGSDFLEHQSLKHKLYCLIFHNGAMNVSVSRVLVYRPEMCKSKLSKQIMKLPTINKNDKQLMALYEKVFKYENDIYRNTFIFLSQRLLGLNCPKIDLYGFISTIFNEADIKNYCYRLHPAEATGTSTMAVNCCYPSEMWELLCMHYITDNHVLVTINSTAAFSPYKIFGTQPYVVFIYNVVGLHDYNLQISEDLALTLKREYSDPSKIFIPRNKEELVDVLAEIKKRVINDGTKEN